METLESMRGEVKTELLTHIIPFWRALRDDTYGGYYGWLSYDLALDQKAEKGCILNSRITWFFSNAYTAYRKGLFTEEDCRSAGYTGEALLEEAKHGYVFLKEHCIDREYGGIYWSLNYDGTPLDTTKHTYNQAFCIYALSSYYEASHDEEALALAKQLFSLIEEKCTDEVGYLEAFTREFQPESNEKLSENGVLADKTMNTLLHVFEAYTELYRVSRDETVGERLRWIMDVFAEKVYNPAKRRQEVFFDAGYHTIITQALAAHIYETAFDGHSLANECDRGVVNTHRVWWVQAETVVGFLNACEQMPDHSEYRDAALAEWQFIKEHVIDPRRGSEWYWEVYEDGSPILDRPIVEPWKCPYHNGRMCIEVLGRIKEN
ncbi:AGE family epimerase/isomerase [Roseburia hominis]|uniref:AGE family epimerase/isomerase n=1 Tax=Roseburia hominis TaxID=301301 RepID=UPI00242A3FA9|nr:AGE family epimerase/isomerase [Roseburia hominis]MBS5060901.1 AGE family epimerase/isomerase [Roseburia hominis]